MTITAGIDVPKPRLDLTTPVLWLVALVLVALIALPLSWLAIYAFTDKARHFTLRISSRCSPIRISSIPC